LAIKRFRQSAGERHQFLHPFAREQVSMTQPPARQRALQKLDALGSFGKLIERHWFCRIRRNCRRVQFSQFRSRMQSQVWRGRDNIWWGERPREPVLKAALPFIDGQSEKQSIR
jgi:hypothetical protein